MKVYVAASWRTASQPHMVLLLREAGHEVYDFRDGGFSWREIDPEWQQWTEPQYKRALDDPLAVGGFWRDMNALRDSEAVVLLQPSGRSAALEFGWACGQGKLTIACLRGMKEPDLMVKMARHIVLEPTDVLGLLRRDW